MEFNDSPEIPDRGKMSDIPSLPLATNSSCMTVRKLNIGTNSKCAKKTVTHKHPTPKRKTKRYFGLLKMSGSNSQPSRCPTRRRSLKRLPQGSMT